MTGTAAGANIFVKYGWRASSALSLGFLGGNLLVMAARGPHCGRKTWFGWAGGLDLRKRQVAAKAGAEKRDEESSSVLEPGPQTLVTGTEGPEGDRTQSQELGEKAV